MPMLSAPLDRDPAQGLRKRIVSQLGRGTLTPAPLSDPIAPPLQPPGTDPAPLEPAPLPGPMQPPIQVGPEPTAPIPPFQPPPPGTDPAPAPISSPGPVPPFQPPPPGSDLRRTIMNRLNTSGTGMTGGMGRAPAMNQSVLDDTVQNPTNVGTGTGIVPPGGILNDSPIDPSVAATRAAGAAGDVPPIPPVTAPGTTTAPKAAGNIPQQAPPGFDQAKWSDPAHQSEKYTVGRILASGGSIEDAAKAIGGTVTKNDWLKTKSGEVFDVLRDAGPGGANAPQWERQDFDAQGNWMPPNFGGPENIPGVGPGAAPAQGAQRTTSGGVNPQGLHPGTGSTEAEWAIGKTLSGEWTQQQANEYLNGLGGGSSASAQSTSTTTAPSSGYNDQVRQMIMDRMKGLGGPVDENSSGISQAVSAMRDEGTREAQNERTALAERLYAQGGGGLDSNALTQQIQQSGEKNAANTSGLRANLIMKEYARQKSELQGYLQMALASGDAESARELQLKMQAIDNELRSQFKGVDLAMFGAQLNQNAAMAGLGNG